MNYDKHVKTLERVRLHFSAASTAYPGTLEALDAAIDLMTAAELSVDENWFAIMKGRAKLTQLATQLDEARSEIADLRVNYTKAGQDYAHECEMRDALQTKLSNLREAAEHIALISDEGGPAWRAFVRAIEESK